jgi:hypothetical protein
VSSISSDQQYLMADLALIQDHCCVYSLLKSNSLSKELEALVKNQVKEENERMYLSLIQKGLISVMML